MANPIEVPAGLEGVIVTDTTVGDVRGKEGFYHYRQYSAVELAGKRTAEDVWHLLVAGDLPSGAEREAFAARTAELRSLPASLVDVLATIAPTSAPLDMLRTGVSAIGAGERWAPTLDLQADELFDQGLRLVAVAPTILTAGHRLAQGLEPVAPRADLGQAANYLWMLTGEEPSPAAARAVEQYLITTMDHGFNSSTFTARVIASTGADLAAAACGAIGALSGPLHGGAPSRALAMLDAIGSPDRADAHIRDLVQRGQRIMGFGHRVYKTEDPRAVFLRDVCRGLGGDLTEFAEQVERTVVDVLAELKPGRDLYTNVEFYAGVVMHSCGIPREMFTPTFAVGRMVGWVANVLEQVAHNRLIRPAARYVGIEPPVPVPEV